MDFVQGLIEHSRRDTPFVLHLFDGPYVMHRGRRAALPEGGKRLLVFIALHRGPVERTYASGALWPVGDDVHAAASLRSTLWRLKRAYGSILSIDKHRIGLSDQVMVDAHLVTAWALRLIQHAGTADDLRSTPRGICHLAFLPGWDDDWAVLERERMRQRLLHAVEALSQQLLRAGRRAEAIEAAMTAVGAAPLRDSAQRALIDAHLADGNVSEARRCHRHYCALLQRELDTRPDRALTGTAQRTGRGYLKLDATRDTRMGSMANGAGHR